MAGIIIVIAIIIAILVGSYLYEKKRREKLEEAAKSMGMLFSAKDEDKSIVAFMSRFVLGKKGNSHKATNILQGESGGMKTLLLDYYYQVGRGKNAQRNNQSLAVFIRSDWDFPNFILRPEKFGDRISKVFGKDDIDFDDFPDFSKMYFLEGANEAAVRQYFTPDMCRFFEENPDWYIEGDRDSLIICRHGSRRSPSEILDFLREALILKDKLLEQLPSK